jgi:TPR repeat protein
MSSLVRRLRGMVSSPEARLKRARDLIKASKVPEAFTILAELAKAENAEAQFMVARCYLEGAGVPPSVAEGVRWLERAAAQNLLDAQAMLAAIYLRGIASYEGTEPAALAGARAASALFHEQSGGTPDYDRARLWATRATDAGSADGQALLAFILTSGPEAQRDLAKAEELYRLSAEADCPQGCLGYALALLPRIREAEKFIPIAALLHKAAAADLPTAIYMLGVLTERGNGVERDVPKATEFYKQAALKGMRSSMARYGLALLEGAGVERDLVEAETWLRRAALQGDPCLLYTSPSPRD